MGFFISLKLQIRGAVRGLFCNDDPGSLSNSLQEQIRSEKQGCGDLQGDFSIIWLDTLRLLRLIHSNNYSIKMNICVLLLFVCNT